MNEWISVKDRLPTKENKVIICLINNEIILCEVHDSTIILNQSCVSFYWPTKKFIKDRYYSEVTHWIPVPPIEKKDE